MKEFTNRNQSINQSINWITNQSHYKSINQSKKRRNKARVMHRNEHQNPFECPVVAPPAAFPESKLTIPLTTRRAMCEYAAPPWAERHGNSRPCECGVLADCKTRESATGTSSPGPRSGVPVPISTANSPSKSAIQVAALRRTFFAAMDFFAMFWTGK